MGVNEIDGEVSDRSIASALLETYNVVSTVLDSDSVNTDLPNMRKIQSLEWPKWRYDTTGC